MLTVRQKEWLQDKNTDKKAVFKWLSKGPLSYGCRINVKTGENSTGIESRGVTIGVYEEGYWDEHKPKAEEKGAKLLKEFADLSKDYPELNEDELGISDKTIRMIEDTNDIGFRINDFVFIGQHLSNHDSVTDVCDNFIESFVELSTERENLKPLKDKMSTILEEEEHEYSFGSESPLKELFFDTCESLGYVGFFLGVEIPVITNAWFCNVEDENPSSYSLSWGYYQTEYVYGDTFDEAFKEAKAAASEAKKQFIEKERKRILEKKE